MGKRHQVNWRLVLVYPAIFLIIVCGGFMWGLTRMEVPSSTSSPGARPLAVSSAENTAVRTAPSVDEYRSAAARALRPFLAVVADYEDATVVQADSEARLKLEDSLQAMLDLTVPASERDFHLSAVLLIEQWKRALAGSTLDARRAVGSAEDFLEEHSWLVARP